MPNRNWQVLPDHLQSEMRFKMALLIAHRGIYNRHFAGDPMVNPALGFHLHGYRYTENWRIVLALTPWMFARLLFAESPPDIEIPDDWLSEQRRSMDYQLLGPMVDLPLETGGTKAHLNYHPTLGHYLLQPIALNMQNYANAREAFEAWNLVIETRDERLKQMEQQCNWQQEISRRELFGKFLG
ncbi:MAG: [NiFe]-hydrogenase assembly chaperone HybE [Candidatus Thiodiazotropha sp.]|jgi:hypothetical protein